MTGITQEQLKELIRYNPESGVFTAKVDRRRLKKGEEINGGLSQQGYRRTTINGKSYLLHRLAWFYAHGVWPKVIDHINTKKTDNRLKNLRDTDIKGNSLNRKISPQNKSGFVGVCWNSRIKRWKAFIGSNSECYKESRSRNLGHYKTKEEAIQARINAELANNYHTHKNML